MTDKPNEPMPDEVWIEDEVMYYAPRLYSPHKRAKYIRADKYDKLRGALVEAEKTLRHYEVQDGGHEAYCARQLIKEVLEETK